ncbi:unnamed protein product [Cylindrotheca closterium]|uniref:DNA polymerase alpha subunit B n=1 Tax=Cylindrotheca closterium TaxID=2856 RepID=A0AAD2PVP6_9STRA|nr:unnamed protein product [Cylindrotheca closterium]
MANSTEDRSKHEIREALKKVGLKKVDNKALIQCVALASTLNVQPEQMAECWEAFSLNKGVSELTDHTLQAYRLQLIKVSEASINPTIIPGAVQSRSTKRQASNMVTPPNTKRPNHRQTAASTNNPAAKSASTSNKLPKYESRTRVGEVVASFNLSHFDPIAPGNKHASCTITPSSDNILVPYRHMFTTLEDRASALEAKLNELGEQIIRQHGIGSGDNGIAPLVEINVPGHDKGCYIGRICNEAHQGKMNQTSVVIEGSSLSCGGARINVDLSTLKSEKIPYSLFSGQIVAIEGMNPTGRSVVAHRICEGAAHGCNKSTIKDLRHHHYEKQDGSAAKVVTACGPFSTSDNLDYQPFVDLIHVIMEQSPDVVILTGPFVDMRHEAIKAGNVQLEVDDNVHQVVPHEALFANKISGLIEEMYTTETEISTQFVLVPSLEDATARMVYPQVPIQDHSGRPEVLKLQGGNMVEVGTLGLERLNAGGLKRIHCFSNPCTFRINETVFGVSSTDTLFHISAEEVNSNLEPGSRLRRIAQHMLQQRSYYPLYPPPASVSMNLDVKKMDGFKMPCRPDVLIVPSRLSPFVTSVLETSVVLNPGHLTKGRSGGTYAIMDIHPIKREKLDGAGDDVQLLHNIPDRVNVAIKRI